MKIEIFKDNMELSMRLCQEVLGSTRIIIPSGSTPREMYKLLATHDIEDKTFYQLDEWVGVGPDVVGSCYQMITTDFLDKAEIVKFKGIDGRKAIDELKLEMCENLSQNIDLAILGVGLNGHLGLNEPGIAYNQDIVISELSSKSKEVAKTKYFDEDIKVEAGITYGVQALLNTDKVIIVLNSIEKKQILDQIIHADNQDIPAIYVKNKDNVVFYVTENLLEKENL